MEGDLICNYKNCRKKLEGNAWVTACSHIFCNEDGEREFSMRFICPACNTELQGDKEINRIQLNPSDQFRAMVLAGQKPEIIMDICSRALSFWNYQVQQEYAYQEYINSKLNDKLKQIDIENDEKLNKLSTENSKLQCEVTSLMKEREAQKGKQQELIETLNDKTRKYKKLQTMYETMRRKCVSGTIFIDKASNRNTSGENSQNFGNFGMQTAASLLKTNNQNDIDKNEDFKIDYNKNENADNFDEICF